MKNAPIYKKPVMLAMLSNEKLTAKYADVNFVLGDREEKLFINAYGKKPEAQLSVYMDIKLSDEFFRKNPNKKEENSVLWRLLSSKCSWYRLVYR